MPTNKTPAIGRFAPSPSGDLHLGTLVGAVVSWWHVRRQGGRWLLRIDDLDPPREVPGSADRIIAGLARCGLEADGPILYQSQRADAYRKAIEALQARGLVFSCWCTRRELREAGHLHRDGQCLHGPVAERPPALRLRVPPGKIRFQDLVCGPVEQDVRRDIGDFVLQRADGVVSYHLATAVDEAWLGITEVIRGRDLLNSTPRQVLLLQLLRLPVPQYGHVPVVLDAGGRKLCKSSGDAPLNLSSPESAIRAALTHLAFPEPPASVREPGALLHWSLQHDPEGLFRPP